MICANCKKDVPSSMDVCPNCGRHLTAASPARKEADSRTYDEQLFELDQKFLRGELDQLEYSQIKSRLERLISECQPAEAEAELAEDFSWEESGAGMGAAESESVTCPMCGKTHPVEETFYCSKCGRDYLCFEHRDPKTSLCVICSQPPAQAQPPAQPPAQPQAPDPSPPAAAIVPDPMEIIEAEPEAEPGPEPRPAPPAAVSSNVISDGRVLRGHKDGVQSISFSPDGKYILSGGDGASLRMWSVRTGQLARSLPAGERGFTQVAITPDGKSAITGDRAQKIVIWDLLLGKNRIIGSHDQWVTGIAVSSDGRFVASTSGDGLLKVWEIGRSTGTPRILQKGRGGLSAVAISANLGYVVAGGQDMKPRVYDLEMGDLIVALKGHGDKICTVAMSSDGSRAVSGAEDMTIKVWDLPAGTEVATLAGHKNPVLALAISPDGKQILSGSGQLGVYKAQLEPDYSVRLWDIESGRELCCFVGHEGSVTSVAFSPDGSLLASSSLDKTIRLWKPPT